MSTFQQSNGNEPSRGVLARPLDALVFLTPQLLFYEIASLVYPERVLAFDFLRRLLGLFGQVGVWAPGLIVLAILLATHAASGEKWVIHWNRVGRMYIEAAVLAAPLLALNWAVPLTAHPDAALGLVGRLALAVGAGIYEEMVFRLILVSTIMIVGVDILKLASSSVIPAAIVLSSLVFAAHHHQPIGAEVFDATRFLFRTVAGVYLALVFWYRGYGPAAGCHAAYNVILVMTGAIMG